MERNDAVQHPTSRVQERPQTFSTTEKQAKKRWSRGKHAVPTGVRPQRRLVQLGSIKGESRGNFGARLVREGRERRPLFEGPFSSSSDVLPLLHRSPSLSGISPSPNLSGLAKGTEERSPSHSVDSSCRASSSQEVHTFARKKPFHRVLASIALSQASAEPARVHSKASTGFSRATRVEPVPRNSSCRSASAIEIAHIFLVVGGGRFVVR